MTPNFEEILLELSYRIPQGIVDLTNEQHLNELIIILEENRIYNSQAINTLKEKVKTPTTSNRKEGESKDYPGYYHIGRGYYSTKPGGEITHKSDSGSIVKLDAKEKAEKNKAVVSKEKKPPTVKANDIEVTDSEKRLSKSNKKDDSEKEQTTTTTKKGGSFKDALFSTAKKSNDAAREKFIDDKRVASQKVLANLIDSSGNINLLSEPGGKAVKVNGKAVQKILDKVFKGEKLSAEEAQAFNKVGKFVTNMESGTTKIYFAKKFVGRHPQQGYDSIMIAEKNIPMADTVKDFALANKLTVGKSSEGAVGKKVFTPTKVAQSINPDEPTAIIDIIKTKKGVKIGDIELTYKTVPNEKALRDSYIKAGMAPEKAAQRALKTLYQTEAYNERINDVADAASKSIPTGKIPMTNFGDVATPKGRRKTINTIIEGSVRMFQRELNKYAETFGKGNLLEKSENKKIFDSLNKLKESNSKYDLQTNPTAREEYKKELDTVLINMANSPDFQDAVADYAEMKAGLQFLAEGKQVYFPASENFQTADIIVLPDEFSIKPKKGQTLEQAIAENLQLYEVSVTYVGGLSVKYKGGGGSANYNKILQTNYKNKETQKRLLGIQSIYGLVYPKNKNEQLNIPNSSIAKTKSELNDFMSWAVKAGIMTKEEAKQLNVVGTKKGNAILDKVLKDVARCKGSNRKNFEEAVKIHHIMQQMTAFVNNRDVKYTRYSNFNEEVYQDKNGVSVRVVDDIADGVSKPCYMNPQHNPGFSTTEDETTGCVTGTPINQNTSHIESSLPKNLLKA
jgi:hypothetical protein